MPRYFTTVLFMSAAMALGACGEESESTATPSTTAAPRGAPSLDDAAPSDAVAGADLAAQAQEAFAAAASTQMDAINSMIDELRTKAEASETNLALQGVLTSAEASMKSVASEISALSGAAASEWESMQGSVTSTLDEVQAAVRDALNAGD